tara:strand:- start:1362 stop:1868 length:507 start_codon:yes stop_codon:yes gene_type:complete
MATFDLTTGQGTGVTGSATGLSKMVMIEKVFDAKKFADNGNTMANGDFIQLIDLPAECFILHVGAEVLTAFDPGTSLTVDIDVAEGDDFVDGGDVTSAGYLAAGSNGHVDYTAVTTFSNRTTATDTIDIKCILSGSAPTVGKLRVYAILIDISGKIEEDLLTSSAEVQ